MTDLEYLHSYVDILPEPLARICRVVLDNEFFIIGYGSSSTDSAHSHHNYPGGLVTHTKEVLEIALDMAASLNADVNVIIAAAIYHDYMKVEDYNTDGTNRPYRKLIRHVSGSYAEFYEKAGRVGLDDDLENQIGHCILAHHGRQEWGSPVEPQTVEAQILHFADMLSMAYGKGRKIPDAEESR